MEIIVSLFYDACALFSYALVVSENMVFFNSYPTFCHEIFKGIVIMMNWLERFIFNDARNIVKEVNICKYEAVLEGHVPPLIWRAKRFDVPTLNSITRLS